MRKIRIILIFLFFLFIPLFLFSQEIEYPEVPGGPFITATSTFPVYVKYIFNFVIAISGLVALAVMVWGGILYLTSGGDATQLSEARNKIVRAGIGLVILLSSYLILSIINPELTFLMVGSTKPTTGIYLIDKDGKRFHVPDTFLTPPTSYQDIKKVEFISASSSLTAIYLYDEENFKGREERVINYKIAGVLTVSSPKSIYFLWNRPGVYLCPATTTVVLPGGETICSQRPLYTAVSIEDLSKQNFDDKAQSIQIKKAPNLFYGAILFEKPGYVSDNACPDVYNQEIPDLDQALLTGYNPPIGRDKLSSIAVFYHEIGREAIGTVIFFDDVACLPGANSIEVSIGSSIWGEPFSNHPYTSTTTWDRKVKSLKINGPGGVLLMTDNRWNPPYQTGHCQFFTPKDTDVTGCIEHLPTEIFHPADETKRPRGYLIVPYFQ